MQYYPAINEVQITISDFGKGIPSNIKEKFGEMSDGRAVELATEEGITTKSKQNNLGSGLSFLVDYVTGNYSKVSIYSLSGGVHCFQNNAGRLVRTPWVGTGRYPGTLVNIVLDRNRFQGDDVEREDLEWI
jgi:hypothetical protein